MHNARHLRPGGEEFRHPAGVFTVYPHAQRQSPGPLQQEKGVEGAERRAGIAQERDPGPENAGDGTVRAGRLHPAHPVMGGIGTVEEGLAFGTGLQSKVPPSTISPPGEVPCPPGRLVAEWATTAAPCSKGRIRVGAAVLSRMSGMPDGEGTRRLAGGDRKRRPPFEGGHPPPAPLTWRGRRARRRAPPSAHGR